MEPIDPETFAQAAGKGKKRTAARTDHLVAKTLAEQPAEVLRKFADAHNMTTSTLALPIQGLYAQEATIPKKHGGERMVALIAASTSVTLKVCAPEFREWD